MDWQCSYRIDKNDIIIEVSEGWRLFAEQNGGVPKCLPEHILGTSLWDHISGVQTKHLYEAILKKVRESGRRISFPFRCDSPDKRRFLTLTIDPLSNGSVIFESEIVKEEPREPVALLGTDTVEVGHLVRICSMCKRINTKYDDWEEVEIAAQKLRIFEMEFLPQLTHGLCPYCYEVTMESLERVS